MLKFSDVFEILYLKRNIVNIFIVQLYILGQKPNLFSD